MLTSAALTHIGNKRQINQDSFLIREDLQLFIVADGMGGHDFGKQASEMACNIVCEAYQKSNDIKSSIIKAHEAIKHQSEINHSINGMGTTIVVVHNLKDKITVSWVGDSRGYQFQSNQLTLITKDHSIVQHLVDKNLISEEEAKIHPKRNLLTQSIGLSTSEELCVDNISIDLPEEGELLICSDGLTNELDEKAITLILSKPESKQSRLQKLINQANANGGKDNITAMIIGNESKRYSSLEFA